MKILITTGLSGNDVGGPAQYAPSLAREFSAMGHQVKVNSYGHIEKLLPLGIRHIFFFIKIFLKVLWAERVITLDTFSVGVPSVFAAKLMGKKVMVRVGGDFLWESYVNRTRYAITLKKFYQEVPVLNSKERVISRLTQVLLNRADIIVFNTEWQKNIWLKAYKISPDKISIIKNFFPPKNESAEPLEKNFLWAGRDTQIKNLATLKEASSLIKGKYPEFRLEIVKNVPHEELIKRIKSCYAVINPSLSDVCPNFILEAISLCKPFIMTKETGLSEICNQGGIFVNPLEKNEIIPAIEKILDPNEYSRYKFELESLQLRRGWREVAEDFLTV